MIVAQRKTIPDLLAMVEQHRKVLVLGCGTCVTVCMAGGEKEVGILASTLRLADREKGRRREVLEATIERQCDREFFDAVREKIESVDAVLSMACGVGAQFALEVFPDTVVLPGLDTKFYGTTLEQGVWAERCSGCGTCVIADYGGVCPITRCATSLLNGPCGGSQKGKCEVDPQNIDCGWQLIYDRMKALGELDKLESVRPIKDWSSGRHGGPGTIVKEEAVP
jgi:ferredoxin